MHVFSMFGPYIYINQFLHAHSVFFFARAYKKHGTLHLCMRKMKWKYLCIYSIYDDFYVSYVY